MDHLLDIDGTDVHAGYLDQLGEPLLPWHQALFDRQDQQLDDMKQLELCDFADSQGDPLLIKLPALVMNL
jgi:hypothetical protein